MKKILTFVGMPGSGKGTCTDYIQNKFGWPIIHFGNMVYEEVQKRGLDNVKDEIFVRNDMRETEGLAVLAKRVSIKIDEYFENGITNIVLDGLYSWSEFKYLKEKYEESLITIAIVADKALRYDRVLKRKDSHRKYTLDQLKKREYAELENLEKGAPIAYADFTILNNGTLSDLIQNLSNTLKKLDIS